MRGFIPFILALVLAPMSCALAGGSADEIRKTIVGRTCTAPGVSYQFGRDGTFRHSSVSNRGMRPGWQGTYTITEGTLSLHVWEDGRIKGTAVVGAWVTGNRLHASNIVPTGKVVTSVCR
jgi:hypothetical protein